MSEPGKAVFLSYASQDAEAARRIAEALRAAGVEVWFDQSELRGGDAWDAKIRRQIKECALFMPIISDATQARAEGYFRLEWKLAVDRSHLMADDAHFLFPVVISDTPESTARVPDRFRDVQWTRLRLDETPGELAARVAKVLGGGAAPGSRAAARTSDSASPTPTRTPSGRKRRPTWVRTAWITVGLIFAVVYGLRPLWRPMNRPGETASAGAASSEAHKLVKQARALMDDDPMVTRENFLTAKRLGERALELDPGDADAYAVAARAGAQLIRDYQDSLPASLATARSRAESAIRLAPNSLEAALALASVNLLSGNRPAEVEKSLAALLDTWPDERRVLRLLQLAALGQDHLDEAQRWIDRAVALPGGDPESLNRRAEILWTRNDYPQMAATLEQSLAQRPTSLACHLKLMLLVWGWGDLAAGREWVEKMPASLLQEDRIANLAFLARYWSRQPEQALEILRGYPRPFIEQGSLFVSTNYLAGCAQLLAGRPEAAKVEFSAGLKAINDRLTQEPSNLRYLHEKTRLLTRLGQRAEAEQTRRVLQELAGANTAVANRPELTLLLGSTDEAIAVCERGVDRSRSRWPIRVNEMRFDPIFDPLRKDPRFQAIVARGEAQLAELRKAGGAGTD
ncbi:MAG TPA: TIR domain-containing protein [Opitutaceae bacterium]|nr:TIR domain-containing protein [Opitutaceae bacterium]